MDRAVLGGEIQRHKGFKYIQIIDYRTPIVDGFPNFRDGILHRIEWEGACGWCLWKENINKPRNLLDCRIHYHTHRLTPTCEAEEWLGAEE